MQNTKISAKPLKLTTGKFPPIPQKCRFQKNKLNGQSRNLRSFHSYLRTFAKFWISLKNTTERTIRYFSSGLVKFY